MCIENIVCNISVVFLRHSVDESTIFAVNTELSKFFNGAVVCKFNKSESYKSLL